MDPSRKIAQQYTAAPPVLPALPAAAASGNRTEPSSAAPKPEDVQAALPSGTVVPGDVLGDSAGITVGAGVYALNGTLRASVVGTPRFTPAASGPTAGVVTVAPARSATTAVPGVGSSVLAKVTRVTSNMVHVRILVVGTTAVGSILESAAASGGGFSGVIKRENCREAEVDKAVLPDMFVPGDVVRATVISLGTRRSYFLATATTDTGVVFATSAAGHPMKPLAHDKMVCSVTGVREPRRVARDGF